MVIAIKIHKAKRPTKLTPQIVIFFRGVNQEDFEDLPGAFILFLSKNAGEDEEDFAFVGSLEIGF